MSTIWFYLFVLDHILTPGTTRARYLSVFFFLTLGGTVDSSTQPWLKSLNQFGGGNRHHETDLSHAAARPRMAWPSCHHQSKQNPSMPTYASFRQKLCETMELLHVLRTRFLLLLITIRILGFVLHRYQTYATSSNIGRVVPQAWQPQRMQHKLIYAHIN